MTTPAAAAINIAINQAERSIARHRAMISERAAAKKPVAALGAVLDQLEGNLKALVRIQAFFEARLPRPRRES